MAALATLPLPLQKVPARTSAAALAAVSEEDPTSSGPWSQTMVERCIAEFCLPNMVLGRLLDQLKEEFAVVEGDKLLTAVANYNPRPT